MTSECQILSDQAKLSCARIGYYLKLLLQCPNRLTLAPDPVASPIIF